MHQASHGDDELPIPASSSTALEATGLTRRARLSRIEEIEILKGADLQLPRGKSVSIVGRSGSGKSTLLALIGLLERPDGGAVLVGGVDPWSLTDRARSRLRNDVLGFVFQSFSLIPHLTAAENVALPLHHGSITSRRRVHALVRQALEDVGLSGRAQSHPRQLSGGEQQRVAIARALVRRPSVVLADEPTGALDTSTAERVLDVLVDTTRCRGASLVLVTHDTDVARRADIRLELKDGLLVPAGEDTAAIPIKTCEVS